MGRARHRRRRWDFEVGVVKGLRGYGIKEEFAHAKSATAAMGVENVSILAPLDLPPPKQGCCSAGDGLVAYAKAFAKCRNVLGSMESRMLKRMEKRPKMRKHSMECGNVE